MWVERLVGPSFTAGCSRWSIGLATRAQDGLLGWALIAVGALIAAIGAALIYVRSRLDQAR